MKRKIFQLLTLAFILITSACNDDRDNFMVDDEIYLLKSGLVKDNVYDWQGSVYDVYAIKSGKGNKGASVKLVVDPTVLSQYNTDNATNYVELPANCYSLTEPQISFGSGDYQKPFKISMNIANIEALAGSGVNYVIPVKMEILNNSIEAGAEGQQMTALLSLNVVKPYLKMANSGLYLPGTELQTDSEDEIVVYSKVATTYNNTNKIDYTIEVDEQLLADYNTANGTSYTALPANAYTIEKNWTVPANSNEAYFNFKIIKKNLMPDANTYAFGSYVIPMKITSVSQYGIDENAKTLLYPIVFQPALIDRSEWTVLEYNSSSKDDETAWIAALDWGAEKLLDGNTETFWGSKWTTPLPLPYYFIFDMQKDYKVFKAGISMPTGTNSWRGDAKAGYVEVSPDNVTWTRICDWSTPTYATRTASGNATPIMTARYVKLVITACYGNNTSGDTSRSKMNVAEFYVWGE